MVLLHPSPKLQKMLDIKVNGRHIKCLVFQISHRRQVEYKLDCLDIVDLIHEMSTINGASCCIVLGDRDQIYRCFMAQSKSDQSWKCSSNIPEN